MTENNVAVPQASTVKPKAAPKPKAEPKAAADAAKAKGKGKGKDKKKGNDEKGKGKGKDKSGKANDKGKGKGNNKKDGPKGSPYAVQDRHTGHLVNTRISKKTRLQAGLDQEINCVEITGLVVDLDVTKVSPLELHGNRGQ